MLLGAGKGEILELRLEMFSLARLVWFNQKFILDPS